MNNPKFLTHTNVLFFFMVCGDLSLMGLQRPVPCIAAVCVVFVFFFINVLPLHGLSQKAMIVRF